MREPRAPALDPRCLLAPELARGLPRGSREREFAALCLRLVWHTLFDTCPGLLADAPPDGARVLEPFLCDAAARGLAMDWTLHAHLLAWLADHPEAAVPLGRDRVLELLAAAASRWALGDQTPDTGVLLASALLPGKGLLAWKPPSLEEGRKVMLVDLGGAPPASGLVMWRTLADAGALATSAGWQTLGA